MSEILRLKEWDKKGTKLSVVYYSASTKWLDSKATKMHKEIDEINKSIMEGRYAITTVLSGYKSKEEYKLTVKIKYYENKSEHEHKTNSHRQEIHI